MNNGFHFIFGNQEIMADYN